jgi:hypothetical protein
MSPAPVGPPPARYWLRLLIIVAVAAAYGLHWRQAWQAEGERSHQREELLATVQSARTLLTALQAHYEAHGLYPETLQELTTTPPARQPPLAGEWVYQAHNAAAARSYRLSVAVAPRGELVYASDGVYPTTSAAGQLHRLGDWGWYR